MDFIVQTYHHEIGWHLVFLNFRSLNIFIFLTFAGGARLATWPEAFFTSNMMFKTALCELPEMVRTHCSPFWNKIVSWQQLNHWVGSQREGCELIIHTSVTIHKYRMLNIFIFTFFNVLKLHCRYKMLLHPHQYDFRTTFVSLMNILVQFMMGRRLEGYHDD